MLQDVGCSTGSMAPIGGALASARSISLVGVHPPMPITIFSPRHLYSLLLACIFMLGGGRPRPWNLTGSDAEAHYTQNGTLVVTLSVATKEAWKDADGNWQSRTDWHRIVSFGKQAEFTRTLTKGSYVMQGAVRTREYERDGVKHRVVEVRADTIGKLDRAERRAEAEGEPDAGDA